MISESSSCVLLLLFSLPLVASPGGGELALPTVAQEPAAFPLATPESQGISAKALQQLSEEVQRFVDKDRIVGAELLVIKNRRTVLHEAFGWRNREAKEPMVRDSIFNIRSMTKPVTGAGAQLLIDGGELTLESRAAEFLPGFDNETSRTITVEQLLTHRSGLPFAVAGASPYPTDLVALANEVGEGGPEFEPGARFWYSDPGSDVLGALTAVASGRSLDEFRTTRLLEPLGMSDTFTATDRNDPRYERIVCLYLGTPGSWTRFWTPEDEPRFPVALGCQTLYGTARDYARFLAMWIDQGLVGEERLLSEAAVERTLRPASRMTATGSDAPMPSCFRGLETHYGQMSIVYVDPAAPPEGSPRVIGHSGSDGTWAWAWPELDLMVLYFTQSRGQASGFRLGMLVDQVLVHAGEPVAALPVEYEPNLGTFVANFGSFHDQEFEIFARDGRLMLDIPSAIVFELEGPDEEGVWTAGLAGELRLEFVRDEAGAVVALRMGGSELPRSEVVRDREAGLELAEVERFLGFYQEMTSGQVVEVVFADGALAVEVPGVPQPLLLHPPDEKGLRALVMSPQSAIRFNEGENGTIDSYSIFVGGVERGERRRVPPPEDR